MYHFFMAEPIRASGISLDSQLTLGASFAAAVKRCWEKADAAREWNVSLEQFGRSVERSVRHRFRSAAANPVIELASRPSAVSSSQTTAQINQYIDTLHAHDLALACACSAGSGVAWDFFVAQFRPELYRAARAIAGEANARELADSLYAELYGLRETEGGTRKSLFDYFHGRSKLGTWLRAILAQRHVDEIRRARRTEPLAEDCEEPARTVGPGAVRIDAPDAEREKYLAMLQTILSAVLGSLDGRARLRLAYCYVENLTLAEIGKLLGEHEATASRALERTRKDVRARVEAALRGERKLSEAQVQQCFEYAREEWPFDLTGVLSVRD